MAAVTRAWERHEKNSSADPEVDGGKVLMSLLNSEKCSPPKRPPPPRSNQQRPSDKHGYIRSIDSAKGCGFITCRETSEDLYVHAKHINGYRVGDYVVFKETWFKGRAEAQDLHRDDEAYKDWEADQQAEPYHEHDIVARAPQVLANLQSDIARDDHAYFNSADHERRSSQKYDYEAFDKGVIKRRDEKGHGYIYCHAKQLDSVFVHAKHMDGYSQGDSVWFKLKWHRGVREAHDLYPVEGEALGKMAGVVDQDHDVLDLRTELQGMSKGALIRRVASLGLDDETLEYATEGTKDDVIELILRVEEPNYFPYGDFSAVDERLLDGRENDVCSDLKIGTIKTIVDDKGWGWIACDDSPKDFFVHSSQLNGCVKGDKVQFHLRHWDGKLQACNLSRFDPNEGQEIGKSHMSSSSSSAPTSADFTPKETFYGFIKSLDEEKGTKGRGYIVSKKTYEIFGFDVYVSVKDCKKGGFKKGDNVSFKVSVDDKGRPRAIKLAAVDETIYMGTVRSFAGDSASGYGFLACSGVTEKYGRDAYLSFKEKKDFKLGDAVKFKVRLNDQGHPQAFNLVEAPKSVSWLGLETPETATAETNEDEASETTSYAGVIKSFDSSNGYGFITCTETSQDYFLPAKQMDESTFAVGDHVIFQLRLFKGKKQAHSLEHDPAFCESKEASIEGAWTGGFIDGTNLSWNDGTQATIVIITPKKFTVTVEDEVVSAELEDDGKLHWSDGDVWMKASDDAKATRQCKNPELSAEDDIEYIGSIKSFNTEKGYGFIQCDELHAKYGRDVFIPLSQYQGLSVGVKVTFRIQVKRGQPQAVDVSIVPTTSPPPPGSYLHLPGEERDELLIRACESTRVTSSEDIKHLIRDGANPNGRDVTGQTPLMIAALQSRFSERKCQALISMNADVHLPSREGRKQTILQWARERINPKFALFLEAVSRGEIADVEIAHDAPADDF